MAVLYVITLLLAFHNCFGKGDVVRSYKDSHPVDLITIWGQNYAAQKIGAREPELIQVCRTSPYDTIIIGYVTRYFDAINQNSNYPGMDFSVHCEIDQELGIIQCPNIQQGIEVCHENNKKVLIGIGGAGAHAQFTTFANEKQAEMFASMIWDLFLSDMETKYPHPKPFGDETVDGVNIDIRHPNLQYLNIFIERLDEFRTNQVGDKIITLTATCDYPNPFLGPGPGKPLEDTIIIDAIDKIFVLFTKETCCVIGGTGFIKSMQKWNVFSAKTQTDLAIGVASNKYAVRNQQCFNTADRVVDAMKTWQEPNPYLNGVFIVDNSFDIMNRQRYGYSMAIEQIFSRPNQLTMVQPLVPGEPPIIQTTIPPITNPPIIEPEEPKPVVLPTEVPEEPPLDQTERPPVLQPENAVEGKEDDLKTPIEPPLEDVPVLPSDEEEIATTTTKPLVDESENLIIDSTTEGTIETNPTTIPTRLPATRAPPLIPQVADGNVPPPPLGGWSQAAEVQKNRVNCTKLHENINENLKQKCAQPYTRKHHGRRRKWCNKKKKPKTSGIQIKFKSKFQPKYIPKSKQHFLKTGGKADRKTNMNRIEINFKSKFKPSLIPIMKRRHKDENYNGRHKKKNDDYYKRKSKVKSNLR